MKVLGVEDLTRPRGCGSLCGESDRPRLLSDIISLCSVSFGASAAGDMMSRPDAAAVIVSTGCATMISSEYSCKDSLALGAIGIRLDVRDVHEHEI